jgi:Flp pilus assembly protein TadG
VALERISRLFSKLIRCRKGAAAVEFGIVVAILFIPLIGGSIELGRGIHHYQVVTKSMRDATRFMSRLPKSAIPDTLDGGAGGTGACSNTENTGVAGQAKNLAMYGNIAGTGTAFLPYWTAPANLATIDMCGPVALGTAGITCGGNAIAGTVTVDGEDLDVEIVCLTTTVTYDDIGFLSALGLGPITYTVAHQQRWIGD